MRGARTCGGPQGGHARAGPPGVRRLVDLLVTAFVFWLVGVALHEFFHYQAAVALGHAAEAHFHSWFAGSVRVASPDGMEPAHAALIGASGGAGVAVFYLLLGWFTDDVEHDLVVYFFGTLHAAYAPMEAMAALGGADQAAVHVVPTLAAGCALAYVAWTKGPAFLGGPPRAAPPCEAAATDPR